MGFRKSKKRNRLYPTGSDAPQWLGGDRGPKVCQLCGKSFTKKKTQSIRTFWAQKFCSKNCSDIGGFRYSGKEHPNYREQARRKNRGGNHRKWVNAVMSRDKATCQKCGATDLELHAHHIKSYRDHPEMRFDVANGITLCFKCHWETHTALNAKAVNSGNTPPEKSEGNPEPSRQRKLMEGVTTRGRVYRRVVGECDWCKSIYSKPLSDVTGKKALFCSTVCRGKWTAANMLGKPRDSKFPPRMPLPKGMR